MTYALPKIDLLMWTDNASSLPHWENGERHLLPSVSLSQVNRELTAYLTRCAASYVLFWHTGRAVPDAKTLHQAIASEADIAHGGTHDAACHFKSDLFLVKQDWSMIEASPDTAHSNWFINPQACFIKTDLLRTMQCLDEAFESVPGAFFDLGWRALSSGAIVEYRTELRASANPSAGVPTARDLYAFGLRHYGTAWGRYVRARRLLKHAWRTERQAYNLARQACANIAAPPEKIISYRNEVSTSQLNAAAVSVIIPTLGRYPYLPVALDSLRAQTIKPREVVVVDQNPAEARVPQTYHGYEDLNVRVIYQNERGQSLARNTGIAAAQSEYVFLFDDDSIAEPDLIERHLRVVLGKRFDVSTGVSYPPPPHDYKLPLNFRHQRLSQTFDTGNSLLPLGVLKKMGGLDRNYDFGPGTDGDFGTRLYLAGYRIAHNPHAARIHFKAPMGGLRVHGSHKYNTDAGLLKPFPPVTQSYYALRYLTAGQRRERIFLQMLTAKFSTHFRSRRRLSPAVVRAVGSVIIGWLLLPIKSRLSYTEAEDLLKRGVRLAEFEAR